MWSLYRTAKTFRCRPSDLLDIDDPFAAYCIDNAVAEFGTALDAELANVEGKTKKELQSKSKRILDKWLTGKVEYRDPVKTGHVQLPGKG